MCSIDCTGICDNIICTTLNRLIHSVVSVFYSTNYESINYRITVILSKRQISRMQRCYSFGEVYSSNHPPNLVLRHPKVAPVHAANIKQIMGDVVLFWKQLFLFEFLLIKRNSYRESNVSPSYHKVIPIHLFSYFSMKRSEVLLGAGLNYFWCIQSLYFCSVFIK